MIVSMLASGKMIIKTELARTQSLMVKNASESIKTIKKAEYVRSHGLMVKSMSARGRKIKKRTRHVNKKQWQNSKWTLENGRVSWFLK